MTYNEWRNLKKPFVCEAKGDVTNMVYAPAGSAIGPRYTPPAPPQSADEDEDGSPASITVSG